MFALLEADMPVASSCDGDGVCAKCRIIISAGAENLTAVNEVESHLNEINEIRSDMRISCQTQVVGDITVDATYW